MKRVFGLRKIYYSGEQTYVRLIGKPVLGSVRVAIAGDPKVETLEFSVEVATGLITFANPPDIDVRITAGCEFDVPVRFDTDRIATSIASFQAGEIPAVPVIEVRL